MKHQRIEIPLKTPIQSLCWNSDSLIDWAAGNRIIHLNGKVEDPHVNWAYRFDAAVTSPSGRYAVIYERLGTKGLILDRGNLLREINRSFYCADVYEYPIVLFQHPDGRELIAHCPEEYNQVEIEETATGKRLTNVPDRKPEDFFHSRLAVSPGSTRLLSAGWVWHPFNSACIWNIAEGLKDSKTLDIAREPLQTTRTEISSAAFVDDDRILINSSTDADHFGDKGDSPFLPGCLGLFNLASNAFEALVKTEENVGSMMWLGDHHVIGLYETPKLFDLRTGRVIFRWPDIPTGTQNSSIIHHVPPLPPIAADPAGKRFAVALKDCIVVIQF